MFNGFDMNLQNFKQKSGTNESKKNKQINKLPKFIIYTRQKSARVNLLIIYNIGAEIFGVHIYTPFCGGKFVKKQLKTTEEIEQISWVFQIKLFSKPGSFYIHRVDFDI